MKSSYEPPRLTKVGSIRDLTLGGWGGRDSWRGHEDPRHRSPQPSPDCLS